MKVILYMAVSVNGYIAREDGKEDFLSHTNWITFVRLAESIGCFVVGRRTYEAVKKFYTDGYNYDTVNAVRIVISKRSKQKPVDGYIFVNSPEKAVRKGKKLGFKNLLLTGGGTINSSFMQKGLVDEIIFNVEPFALGKGICVFWPQDFSYKLRLLSTKKLNGGVLQIRYKVLR